MQSISEQLGWENPLALTVWGGGGAVIRKMITGKSVAWGQLTADNGKEDSARVYHCIRTIRILNLIKYTSIQCTYVDWY